MLPHFWEVSQFLDSTQTCDIGHKLRDDLVDLILLLSRTCHQHQLRGCYSCSLICMFLYIFFSRYFSTTRVPAMECDVSAYVFLIMCNSSQFLHKVHQLQPICYYQSVKKWGMIQSCLQCGDLLYQFPAKSSNFKLCCLKRCGMI